jgi:RNA polymerase sigma factor (sigma-70 family)
LLNRDYPTTWQVVLQNLSMFFKKRHKPFSEAELLAEYRKTGDLALLGQLYEPQMEKVFAVCFKYFKDEEDAKDATMQIFEKLISDLKRHEVENFQAWLGTLTRNFCLMELRKKKTMVEVSENESQDDDQDEQNSFNFMEFSKDSHLDNEPLDLEENLTQLEKCLETLSAEQKLSIDLFFLKENTYQEVVQITGFEMNKVKSYLQNGKRNLKICMESSSI